MKKVEPLSLERKIELINEEMERKNNEATQLLEYLIIQRDKAKMLEEQEEEELKKKGIVIGQHIPSLKSKFALDADKLCEFGDYSSTLLIAKDLVDQNKTNFLRRTGNLPISDAAEAKKLKFEQSQIGIEPDMPHYLTRTNNTNVRQDRVSVRFSETLQTHQMERTKLLETQQSSSLNMTEAQQKKPKYKKKAMLSAIQKEENENILKGINHKLNYLRNPRNDPAAVTKMLNKGKAYFSVENREAQAAAAAAANGSVSSQQSYDQYSINSASQAGGYDSGDDGGQSSVGAAHGGSVLKARLTGRGAHAMSVGHQEGLGSSNIVDLNALSLNKEPKKRSKYDKPEPITDNPLFVSEPSLVNFTNYEVGRKYTQVFAFRNVSAVTRTVRILPPRNKVFSIAPLRYPTNSNGGMVAPGMCAQTTLSFYPSSLGDFSDFLRVETESGSYKVQIHAQREPPYLSIPSVLNVGYCLVGDASRVSINCLNTGGAGKFTLCTEEQYLNQQCEPSANNNNNNNNNGNESNGAVVVARSDCGGLGCMRMPPFTMYPTEFSLLRNESAVLNIEFVPLSIDAFEYPFYMKCDNGTVRKFTVRGESKQLNVTLAEVNTVPYNCMDERQYADVLFPTAFIGTEQTQSVVVVNDTGLPVEYEWVWFTNQDIAKLNGVNGGGCGSEFTASAQQALNKIGQSKIHVRELESMAEHGFYQTSTTSDEEETEGKAGKAAANTDPENQSIGGGGGGGSETHYRDAVTVGLMNANNLPLPTPPTSAAAGQRGNFNSPDGHGHGVGRGSVPGKDHASMVRSMKMTMMDMTDAEQLNSTNRTVCEQFEIFPARGVLPNDGAESFTVTFTPSDLITANMRAVLMIKSVPLSSLPPPLPVVNALENGVFDEASGSVLDGNHSASYQSLGSQTSQGSVSGSQTSLYLSSHMNNNKQQQQQQQQQAPFVNMQAKYLQKLSTFGHGSFTRLRSWLEEIGTLGTVATFTKPNGDEATEEKLVSLHTLLHLVLSQAMAGSHADDEVPVPESEFARINIWIRKSLVHLFNFRKAAALSDDDEDEDDEEDEENRENGDFSGAIGGHLEGVEQQGSVGSLISDGGGNGNDNGSGPQSGRQSGRKPRPTVLELYDWSRSEGNDASTATPIKIYPIKLTPDSTLPVKKVDRFAKLNGIVEEDVDENSLHSFSTTDRVLLHEIWLDVKHCLLLLGQPICELLNSKVKHEAIEYLKDNTLNHVAALQFNTFGEGMVQYIQVSPPVVEIAGHLSIGKVWKGEFKLVNRTNAMAEIEINTKDCTIARISSNLPFLEDPRVSSPASPTHSHNGMGFGNDKSDPFMETAISEKYSVSMDVTRILLMPHSEESITLSVVLNMLGRYELSVPFECKSKYTHGDVLKIVCDIAGPRLRFDTAEVDIGLIGVGGDTSKTLSFTNEGDVPLMFMMRPSLYVDISDKGITNVATGAAKALGLDSGSGSVVSGGGGNTGRSRQNSHREKDSARSHSRMSRQSTARSGDFSVIDSTASDQGEFRIELKNAVVTIDPPNGIVGPQQSFSVTVNCKAGKIGQRIRGMIESRVFDVHGKVEILSHFMNMRGEVQAPKTCMYPLSHNLGQVYVGMPVHFTVKIENICNLPTKYKLLRPGGESSLYRLSFDKDRGPLGPKEIITVNCTFVALTTGHIDDVIANKIFGATLPLGFSIKAMVKGISLEFQNLTDDEPLPAPIADVNETQYPGDGKPPEPHDIEPLEMGDSIPLYERKYVRVAIRNLSAIPAVYELAPKRFKVIEVKKFGTSSIASVVTNVSLNVAERKDLILAPHEGGANKFQSEAGKQYITATVQRQQDRAFIQSGLGASYLIENSSGTVPPWGVQEVIVRAFNDIPGCYHDVIECLLHEGEVTRTFNIPVHLNVTGCPIIIEKQTVGMTTVLHEPKEFIGKQVLHLGHACVDSEPLVREFYIRNNGSKKGNVKWQVKGVTQKANGPLKLSLHVDEKTGRVKHVFRFWEDIARDSPFKVEPQSCVVKPYGRQKFKVTLFRTQSVGREMAQLTGSVLFTEDTPAISVSGGAVPSTVNSLGTPNHSTVLDGTGSITLPTAVAIAAHSVTHSFNQQQQHSPQQQSRGGGMSVSSSTASINSRAPKLGSIGRMSSSLDRFTLSLLLQGDFVHPTVVIDKNTLVARDDVTQVSQEYAVQLRSQSTLLFGSNRAAKPADICNKPLTVVNPLDAVLSFTVTTEGPFILQDTNDERNSPGYTTPSAPPGATATGVGGKSSAIVSKRDLLAVANSGASVAGSVSLASQSVVTRGAAGGGMPGTRERSYHLLPNKSGSFAVAFQPKRDTRERLISLFGTEAGKPTEQHGKLIFSYSTGQSLHIPIVTKISTPFLAGSTPRLYYGVCHTTQSCSGLFLLTNPTDVTARWWVEHMVGGGAWRKNTAIRVQGFFENEVEEVDDPSVFTISPDSGTVSGPTVSVTAAVAAPPRDFNRKVDTIVPQRVVESSWASSTLTMKDNLCLKHEEQHQSEADARFPLPLTIQFSPKKNVSYCSRFKFSCEFGNSFELVLQGRGTYEEHEHKPLNPIPK